MRYMGINFSEPSLRYLSITLWKGIGGAAVNSYNLQHENGSLGFIPCKTYPDECNWVFLSFKKNLYIIYTKK